MKGLLFVLFFLLTSCAEEEEETFQIKQRPSINDYNTKQDKKNQSNKPQGALTRKMQGYQDKLQQARDMEKKVLESADRQRKAIDG